MTDQSAPDAGPSWLDNLTSSVKGFLGSKPMEVAPRKNVDMAHWSPILEANNIPPSDPQYKLLKGISEHINSQPMPEQPTWGKSLAVAGLGGLSAGLLRAGGASPEFAAQSGMAPAADIAGQRNKVEQAQQAGWTQGGAAAGGLATQYTQQNEILKRINANNDAAAKRIFNTGDAATAQPAQANPSAPSAPNPQAPNQRVDFGRQVYDYFVGKGLTPPQAAAFAGNFAWESGGRTDTVSKYDNPKYAATPHSGGIGQWNDRLPGLFKFAADQGANVNPNIDYRNAAAVKAGLQQIPLKTQLDYAWQEMQGPENRAFKMATAGSGQTAEDFRQAGRGAISYHRPAGWTPAAYRNPELAERGHAFAQRMLLGQQAARASIAGHQQAAMQPGTSDLGGFGGSSAPNGPGGAGPPQPPQTAAGGPPAAAAGHGAAVAAGAPAPAGGAPGAPQPPRQPTGPTGQPVQPINGRSPIVQPDQPMYDLGNGNSPHKFWTPQWRDTARSVIQGHLNNAQLQGLLPAGLKQDPSKGPTATAEDMLIQLHKADEEAYKASPAYQTHVELAKANAGARQKASSDAETAVDKEATEAKLNNHTLDILDAAYQETKKKGVLGPGFGDELLQAGNNLLDRFGIPHANTGPVGVIGELANREAIQNMMSELAASGGTGPKGGQAMFKAFKAAVANSSQSPGQFESILQAMRAINADHIARQTAKNAIKQEDLRNGGFGLYEPWQHQERIDRYTQAVHAQALDAIKQVLRTAPTPPAEEAAGGATAAVAPPTPEQRDQVRALIKQGVPQAEAIARVRASSPAAPAAGAPAAAASANDDGISVFGPMRESPGAPMGDKEVARPFDTRPGKGSLIRPIWDRFHPRAAKEGNYDEQEERLQRIRGMIPR